MDTLSGDLLASVLILLRLSSIVHLSVTSYNMNQWIARLLNFYSPTGTSWWHRKLLLDYPNEKGIPLLPNEAHVLLSMRLIPRMQFALQHNKEAMLAYINRLENVSFNIVMTKETTVLTTEETVFLLRNKQYDIIWRAIRATKRFPVQELMSLEGNLSLLEPMLEHKEMSANMIIVLLDTVIHHATAPRDILRKLASLPISPSTKIFEDCMLLSKEGDAACDMVLDGLLSTADIWVDTSGSPIRERKLSEYLYEAIMRGRNDLVQRLLLEGANPNDPVVPNGFRPLDDAISLRNETVVRMLIASPLFVKGRVNQDNIRRTRGTLNKLVHQLISEGKIEVVR